jgi:DNA-binding transcriptional LysR family regulator
MDVTQLYYFIVAAEKQHMTHASEILSLSQSALSRSITSLERELGVPLFDRKNRKIILNRYGKVFLEDAKRIVNQLESSKENLSQLIHPDLGNISISFVHSLGLTYIPSLLKEFQLTNPGHTITLNEDNASLIVKDLLTNETDLGFATHFESHADLVFNPIFKEKIVLISSTQHPFAEMNSIKLDNIMREKFIHYHSETELRHLIDSYFLKNDIHIDVAYDGIEINSIVGLVAANMGIALVPQSTVQNINGIKTIDVIDFELNRTIYLIHKREGYLSKAVLYFKEFICSYHGLIITGNL